MKMFPFELRIWSTLIFTEMKFGKVFRPFLKRSLLIVTAVFLDFGLKSSLDLLTAKQNIKYEHPTFSQFLARIPYPCSAA